MSDNSPSNTISGIPVLADPEYRSVYSNLFRYRISPTDFAITFSMTVDQGGIVGQSTAVLDKVQVTMVLGQAKALAEYLSLIIQRYEREIGPISAPGPSPNPGEFDNMFAMLRTIGSH